MPVRDSSYSSVSLALDEKARERVLDEHKRRDNLGCEKSGDEFMIFFFLIFQALDEIAFTPLRNLQVFLKEQFTGVAASNINLALVWSTGLLFTVYFYWQWRKERKRLLDLVSFNYLLLTIKENGWENIQNAEELENDESQVERYLQSKADELYGKGVYEVVYVQKEKRKKDRFYLLPSKQKASESKGASIFSRLSWTFFWGSFIFAFAYWMFWMPSVLEVSHLNASSLNSGSTLFDTMGGGSMWPIVFPTFFAAVYFARKAYGYWIEKSEANKGPSIQKDDQAAADLSRYIAHQQHLKAEKGKLDEIMQNNGLTMAEIVPQDRYIEARASRSQKPFNEAITFGHFSRVMLYLVLLGGAITGAVFPLLGLINFNSTLGAGNAVWQLGLSISAGFLGSLFALSHRMKRFQPELRLIFAGIHKFAEGFIIATFIAWPILEILSFQGILTAAHYGVTPMTAVIFAAGVITGLVLAYKKIRGEIDDHKAAQEKADKHWTVLEKVEALSRKNAVLKEQLSKCGLKIESLVDDSKFFSHLKVSPKGMLAKMTSATSEAFKFFFMVIVPRAGSGMLLARLLLDSGLFVGGLAGLSDPAFAAIATVLGITWAIFMSIYKYNVENNHAGNKENLAESELRLTCLEDENELLEQHLDVQEAIKHKKAEHTASCVNWRQYKRQVSLRTQCTLMGVDIPKPAPNDGDGEEDDDAKEAARSPRTS